jgi:hypothetical protein
MAEDAVAFDKAELRSIIYAFKGMDEEAATKAKTVSNGLATYLQTKIISKAQGRDRASMRIADGSRVSKSSKIGEMSFGFASQKFSGGGTTQQLWGGYEFGSNKFKQFPIWSGREGRGSKGWFIYPTLKAEQPQIIAQWQEAFSQIVKVW